MKVFITFLLPVVLITVTSFGQTTSNQVNPSWTTDTHWTAGAPGYDMTQSATLADNSSVTSEIIVKSNYVLIIEAGVTLTTNQNFTIKENSTVIIRGTLQGTNAGSEFKIEGNATLIVESGGSIDWAGNWSTNDSSVDIIIDGTVHVDGNFFNKGTITGSGELTVEGAVNNDGGVMFGCNSSGDGCCSSSPCVLQMPLPVVLLYFVASQTDQVIELAWATAMEENFMKFIVQRSSENLIFEGIGEVPGKGFNIYDIESKYSFTDEAPLLGYNYYRLKALDLDGSFEYFGVKAVNFQGSKKLMVYPNPSSGQVISFRTNFSPSESDRIILLNPLGVEVLNSRVSTTPNSITLERKVLAGLYILRYISGDFEHSVRVVIGNQ